MFPGGVCGSLSGPRARAPEHSCVLLLLCSAYTDSSTSVSVTGNLVLPFRGQPLAVPGHAHIPPSLAPGKAPSFARLNHL